MGSAEHKELVPLVEVSLAIMRLACEKFFVLISVLATYLLFRDEAPRPARLLIRLNHRLSVLFQRVCCCRQNLCPYHSVQCRFTAVLCSAQSCGLTTPKACMLNCCAMPIKQQKAANCLSRLRQRNSRKVR